MNDGIKNKVLKGLLWTYMERVAAQLVSVIVTVVLANILTPKEYGMISIVTIFTELANVIVVNGFATALIQKSNPTSKDYSTIFWANMGITWIMYILLFAYSPIIALFYNIEQLTPVLRVLGLQMPIAGISSIQQAFISKKMEFKKFFFSTIIGTVISAIIGIILAFNGFGVWALVIQLLTNRVIDTIILSFTSGWRLTKEFSESNLKELVSYSWKVSASSFLITLWDNVRGLVVGKKYTTDDLAYYDKGRQFPNLIAANINTSISKVLFPALSSEQNNKNNILMMTRRSIKEGAYILTPILLGLAACSESFIKVLFPKIWMPMVPYLQIMCLIYAMQPLQTSSIQAIKAIGRSDTYLKLEIIKKSVNFLILLGSLFLFNNVLAVVFGALLSEIFSTICNFPANKHIFDYTYKEQFLDLLPSLLMSSVMFISVYFVGKLIEFEMVSLIIQIVFGGIVYLVMSIIFKVESFNYTKNIIKEILGKGKK